MIKGIWGLEMEFDHITLAESLGAPEGSRPVFTEHGRCLEVHAKLKRELCVSYWG